MGVEIKKAEHDTWFIAKNSDNSVIHTGFIEKGGSMKSGQPELEIFETEEDMKDRLNIISPEA